LLTESVLLSLVGGLLGVLFAFAATQSIVAMMPEFYVPNESRVTINLPVLAFSFVVSLVTGILFGIVPAMSMSKPDTTNALRTGRSLGEGAEGSRSRNVLVVVEVALSVVLLVSAGLTLRTFLALVNMDAGVKAANVTMLSLPLPPAKYSTLEARNRVAEDLLDRVVQLPGVESATFGHPFGGGQTSFTIIGRATDESKRLTLNLIGADHLRTFGIPLRRGRMFDESEVRRGDRIAVINEAALTLWPAGEDPIGARVRLDVLEHLPPRTIGDTSQPPEVTIVGVIGNTRNAGLREDPLPVVALPYTLLAPPQRLFAIRTTGDPNLILNSVRGAVRAIDPEQPLGRGITVSEVIGQDIVQPRFTMALFATFAALGLLLAAAGVYSVLSFHVTRRTHELGLRMALGAPRRHVLGLMLTMGGRLVLAGLVVGVAISLASTRLLRSQLFGVQPADPLSYVAVAVLLACVALVACYIPARRAAAVDPLVALRQD
jgi:putative ABC transport system permease protein